ncbi:hypothetical protein EBU71_20520, partial [bacterium]|nr:hypothetical protein [Candidatus Elulimicrobium humile]
ITKKYATDQVNGSDYDPKSIMLYSYPAWLTNNKVGTYRNLFLSDYDKEWLSAIYPKSGNRRIPERKSQLEAGTAFASDGGSKGKSVGMIIGIVIAVVVLGGGGYWLWKSKRNSRSSGYGGYGGEPGYVPM